MQSNLIQYICQDLQRSLYIADGGDVMQNAGLVDQRTGKENGESGVFHAADGDGAVQATTAANKQFFHSICTRRDRREGWHRREYQVLQNGRSI